MPKRNPNQKFHEHVQSDIEEMGIADPREAVRAKARAKLTEFNSPFESPPYDLSDNLASSVVAVDDYVKINVEQIFKLLSPGTEVKSI